MKTGLRLIVRPPDDPPASTSTEKSVLTKEYWGKVWAERPPLAAFGSQVRGGGGEGSIFFHGPLNHPLNLPLTHGDVLSF